MGNAQLVKMILLAKVVLIVLVVFLVIAGLVYLTCLLSDKYYLRRKNAFAFMLAELIEEAKRNTSEAWGFDGIFRFLAVKVDCFLNEIIKGEQGKNNCLAYLILSKYPDNGYKNFDCSSADIKFLDFPGEKSVESFLRKIIKRADNYIMARERATIEYREIEDFHGPQKIYLHVKNGYVHFIFLENHIQFISFQISEVVYNFIGSNFVGQQIFKSIPGFDYTIESGKGRFEVVFKNLESKFEHRFSCGLKDFEDALKRELETYSTFIQFGNSKQQQ